MIKGIEPNHIYSILIVVIRRLTFANLDDFSQYVVKSENFRFVDIVNCNGVLFKLLCNINLDSLLGRFHDGLVSLANGFVDIGDEDWSLLAVLLNFGDLLEQLRVVVECFVG